MKFCFDRRRRWSESPSCFKAWRTCWLEGVCFACFRQMCRCCRMIQDGTAVFSDWLSQPLISLLQYYVTLVSQLMTLSNALDWWGPYSGDAGSVRHSWTFSLNTLTDCRLRYLYLRMTLLRWLITLTSSVFPAFPWSSSVSIKMKSQVSTQRTLHVQPTSYFILPQQDLLTRDKSADGLRVPMSLKT